MCIYTVVALRYGKSILIRTMTLSLPLVTPRTPRYKPKHALPPALLHKSPLAFHLKDIRLSGSGVKAAYILSRTRDRGTHCAGHFIRGPRGTGLSKSALARDTRGPSGGCGDTHSRRRRKATHPEMYTHARSSSTARHTRSASASIRCWTYVRATPCRPSRECATR